MEKNTGVDLRVECKGLSGSSEEIVSRPSPFDSLPEECISNIISFTSPRDACIAASLSKTFGHAANSDSVWDKFLPPEYYSSLILGSQVFSSKKELCFSLSHHFLIEDGNKVYMFPDLFLYRNDHVDICYKFLIPYIGGIFVINLIRSSTTVWFGNSKSFWLEKGSGKKCVMLSSKELTITFDYIHRFVEMVSLPESRFEKAARLLSVWGYEIRGRICTRYLSPKTHYSAYIVFKTTNECRSSPDLPVEVGIWLVGQEISSRPVYVDRYRYMDTRIRKEGEEMRAVIKPNKREDGWLELEFGEFFNEDGYDQIEWRFIETKYAQWKLSGNEKAHKTCSPRVPKTWYSLE